MILDLLYIVLGLCIGTAMVWKACDQLEDACNDLALCYGMPDAVKGSTVMAVSSSFPELATIVLATGIHGDFELGLATIIGSAVFNILVIPGTSVFFKDGALEADRNVIFREAQFYLISILIIMLTLAFATIYNPTTGSATEGSLTNTQALLPLLFYVLYIFIQYHEVLDHDPEEHNCNVIMSWIRLVISMAVVTLGVELLILAVIELGEIFDTPSYFWGATVLAAATIIPDLFVSVKAAQRKLSTASLTNALGSNTFDLLVVLPAGVLVVGVVTFDFDRIAPMIMFLVAATVAVLMLARSGFELTRGNGKILLFLYGAFIFWMAWESFI